MQQDRTDLPASVQGGAEKPPGPAAPDRLLQHLAAIVEGSDDAILTKDLNGIITSWNRGAEHLFGYTAQEAIGRPVLMLMPPERESEETTILARIRRGERVDHYETIRQRKNGSLIHISLTVSPLRDPTGAIFGASKIARDITERHRAEERQRLLLAEMQHRIKNVFALAGGLVRLCAQQADTPRELAQLVQARLQALAQAQALTVPGPEAGEGGGESRTTLHALVRVLCEPIGGNLGERLIVQGDDVSLSGRGITPLALVLHELMTNAAKYGALGTPGGTITVTSRQQGDRLTIRWSERTSRSPALAPGHEGFGGQLIRMTVEGELDGSITREWAAEGLNITLDLRRARLG
ncbi:MAG TPA: PAS domain S-box protein [Paracoccus sp. (in: a-proteobacteria)]|nr:PAS domain S-box protein [Paracoccus sp. (in: a-proteobacteria)]